MAWTVLEGRVRHAALVTYAIDPRSLAGLAPAGTELDFWRGHSFVSLGGFHLAHRRLLGVPVPFLHGYDQVHLRFYVRRREQSGWRRGVVYLREIVPARRIVTGARLLFGESYERQPVTSRVRLPDTDPARPGRVLYRWRMGQGAVHRLALDFGGRLRLPDAGSLEEFVLDRPWAYVDPDPESPTREYRIEHPPWRMWPAVAAPLAEHTVAMFGDRFAPALSRPPASALVAEGSALRVLRPLALDETAAPGPAVTPPRPAGAP